MTAQIPLVDYLALGDEPHLVPTSARAAGPGSSTAATPARRASATRHVDASPPRASCRRSRSSRSPPRASPSRSWPASSTATARASAATSSTTEPDPEHVTLGMKVKLATYVVGTDDDGTEAVGFGFEPHLRGEQPMA